MVRRDRPLALRVCIATTATPQQRAADDGSRAQSELSQTRHVNSSLHQILRNAPPPVTVVAALPCPDIGTVKKIALRDQFTSA
jgi:hypothetical protein